MTAEILREAAALIRGRVEKAPKETRTSGLTTGVWLNSAYHLTTTPAVSLAVADWLEQMARGMAGTSYGDLPFEDAALAVARAYLGDPS